MAKLTLPRTDDYIGWTDLIGPDRFSVRIGHNTYAHRTEIDGLHAIGIRLHCTDVVTFVEDGRIILDSGGWLSVTTKNRMNAVLPSRCHVSQEKYEWFVTTHGLREDFRDGYTIHTEDPRK